MEQRAYHGTITPTDLADYLVATFNQGRTTAQKVGQDDHLLVQIALLHHGGWRIRTAITVGIAKTGDGVSVVIGQSPWLDDPGLIGGLIDAIVWPPLVLFPLDRGIRDYALYQDIWNTVDTYCTQAGATRGQTTATHGVYCRRCGAANDEDAVTCALCETPLPSVQPSSPAATAVERGVCPHCGYPRNGGTFCSNCGAPLEPVALTRP